MRRASTIAAASEDDGDEAPSYEGIGHGDDEDGGGPGHAPVRTAPAMSGRPDGFQGASASLQGTSSARRPPTVPDPIDAEIPW